MTPSWGAGDYSFLDGRATFQSLDGRFPVRFLEIPHALSVHVFLPSAFRPLKLDRCRRARKPPPSPFLPLNSKRPRVPRSLSKTVEDRDSSFL